ncbi:YetF domain-containing protein [Paenisporosarcina quisquiliarum]|uniref:YetF domain-containing protein n=1 Tax=Paenisporosarcina quisquiliarum TaxID=365346 RepID=UPI003736EDC7
MNMEDYSFFEMLIRTTVTFSVLLGLARILGKEQLSQLTFFNYITGITIGSIAGEVVAHDDTHYLNAITSLIWWSLLTILVSFISIKSNRAKSLLDDKPLIVIKEGKILEKALKSSRLPIGDLNMLLRIQGIFSVKDVHFAVLETNGELSVFKKVSQQSATKQDVKAPTGTPKFMPCTIIADGKVVLKNLHGVGLTEEWLHKQLVKHGVNSVEQVFYAEVESDGSLYLDLREDGIPVK